MLASTTRPATAATRTLSPAALPDLLRASGGQLVDGAVLLSWIVLSAGEFRHRTSVTTFLGQPRRLRVVSAKLAAAALTGAAAGLLAEALSAATSAAALSAHHVPLHWAQPGVPGAVITVPLLAALYGMLGASLGLLLRNTAAALGLALMWAFVIEGILPVLIHAPGVDPLAPRSRRQRRAPRRPRHRHHAARRRGARRPHRLRGRAGHRRRDSHHPARDRHHHRMTSPPGRIPAARQTTSRAARTRPRPAPHARGAAGAGPMLSAALRGHGPIGGA